MPRDRHAQRGYALLIMMIILAMGSLYGVVSQLEVVTRKYALGNSAARTLAQAKEALIGYAVIYRDNHASEGFGYLVCPDTDGDGDADALDDCGSQDETVVGLLPYRTLGLPQLRDADGNCLWYAVSGRYKNNPKTSVMNWDTRGQLKILDSDGATVLADPDTDESGGAAAVIFAPGIDLSGGRSTDATKPCGVPTTGSRKWNTYLESLALDDDGHSTASPLAIQRGSSGSSTNNDSLAWITPKDIWNTVRKRADRGGINLFSDELKARLEEGVLDDLRTTGLAAAGNRPANPDTLAMPTRYAGELPSTLTTVGSSYTAYLTNWKEQYRYAVCDNLCGYCLTIGGEACAATLLLGGAHTTGGPRSSHPTAFADLFENDGTVAGDGKGALPLLTGAATQFTGASTHGGGHADVGVCLAPRSKMLTSRCDTATFTAMAPDFGGGRTLVAIDAAMHTVTLGKQYGGVSPTATANLFGCAWSDNTYSFGTGIRVYFTFTINNSGEGFTFSVIDANVHPSGTYPCGKTGGRLGYAGDNGVSAPINPPKIGLEIDTRSSSGDGITGSFGDPSSAKHAAIAFWGADNVGADDDDNTHGTAADSAGYPSNPDNRKRTPTSTGVSADMTFNTGTAYHVRLDIARGYDAAAKTGAYTIKAWITNTTDATALADLRNMAVDFTGTTSGAAGGALAAETVSHTVTMANLPTGGADDPEALRTIRLGFTNAQSSSRDQEIVISDLATRIR